MAGERFSLEVPSVLPEPGGLVWLKHNGVFRLKSQSLIDHIQHADLVDRGRCGRRARHNSPHPKTKNDPTVADTFVLLLTDWICCHSAMRPNVPVRSALG